MSDDKKVDDTASTNTKAKYAWDEESKPDLTNQDLDKLHSYLEKILGEGVSCNVCGHDFWVGHPIVHTNTKFSLGKDKHLHNAVFPFIVAECENCGQLLNFHARKAGISVKGEIEPGNSSGDDK